MQSTSIEVAFAGTISWEPKFGVTKEGKSYARVAVAVGTGDKRTFINGATFSEPMVERLRKTGELKGVSVYVEGDSLRVSPYTHEETGEKRFSLECIIKRIERVGTSAIGKIEVLPRHKGARD